MLEHLKVSRGHAVGFALGGQIAQALAILRPDLVATLTIAAAGAGTKATDGWPRVIRNTDEEEIRAHGFEKLFSAISKTPHMHSMKSLARTPRSGAALSDALWQSQPDGTTPLHHDAGALGILWACPKVTVRHGSGGAGDDVHRGGSTPAGTERLAEVCRTEWSGSNVSYELWDGDGDFALCLQILWSGIRFAG